mgnify:FL=1
MKRKPLFEGYRVKIVSSFAGAFVGYFLFLPYTMLVYSIMRRQEGEEFHFHWKSLLSAALRSFDPMMAPMASAFMLFCAMIGLLIGIMVDKKRKLYAAEYENEKKKVALETLHRLIVTLAHFLLNANMIIGGRVRHSRKNEPNEDIIATLDVIEDQAKKIDAVITALNRVTEIKTAHYTEEDHELMIDITKEIEKELNKTK